MAAITASVATGVYRPPGATGTTTLGTGPSSPTVAVNFGTSTAQPGDTDTFLYYFIVPYLDAHVLSVPSWRYAYILWIIIAFIIVVWSLGHQLKRSAGPNTATALIRKATVRRVAFGSNATKPAPLGSNKSSWFTVTYGQLLALLAFTGVILAVTFAGPDYLSPTTCTWGGTCEVQVFNSGPPRSTYTRAAKRDVAFDPISPFRGAGVARREQPGRIAQRLDTVLDRNEPAPPAPASHPMARIRIQRATSRSKRQPEQEVSRRSLEPRASALALNPGGWAPFNDPLLAAPNFTINRLMWTTSSRIGLIAYALLPLVVCLSLKMWPFAIFAVPWLTDYSYDKTAVMHRWFGRIVWVLSTAHTVTFAIQLAWDYDPYGRRILLVVWEYYRFNWGVTAYVALTLMVALSFNPLRKRYYEAFYYSHCVLVVVFLIGCIVHYEPLWGWATLAVALWAVERASRFIVWLWINGFFGLSPVGLWWFWSEAEGRKVMRSWRRTSDSSLHAGLPAAHPIPALRPDLEPSIPYGTRGETARRPDIGARQPSVPSDHDGDTSTLVGVRPDPYQSSWPARQSLYAYGFADNPTHTPHLAQYPPREDHSSTRQLTSPSQHRLAIPDLDPALDRFAAGVPSSAAGTQTRAPPGFAFVQLLPGRSLRLTINTPRRIRWRAGQNVLINVPSVAWWQTHPYTIVNANVGPAVEANGSEVVILLRARRGFTRALYDKVAAERRDLEARMGAAAAGRANGILLRAMVSHPMGSAGRNRWQWYSTVILICGGSGVAFGMGVLEELCSRMANLNSKGGNRGRTVRVRFVWIIREYAHLAWVAPALRRCMEAVSPAQLRVDLHVTSSAPSWPRRQAVQTLNGPEKADGLLLPPSAPFTKTHTYPDGSGASSPYESDDESPRTPTADFYDLYAVDADFTEFDGEVRQQTATELQVSAHVEQEGRLRRALSRRSRSATTKEAVKEQASEYPAPLRSQSFGDIDRGDAASLGAGSRTALMAPTALPAHPVEHDADPFLDIDGDERQDLDVIAELARPGKPHLGEIIDEELARSRGETMVAACGPLTLNTLVRRLVADRLGARASGLDVYTEDFTY